MPKTTIELDEATADTIVKAIDATGERIKPIEKNQDLLLKNYDQLSKDAKKAMEDLTLLKGAADKQAETLQAIQKVQLQLRREAVIAGIDPIKRIEGNPQLRGMLNMFFRAALAKEGDTDKIVEQIGSQCDIKMPAREMRAFMGRSGNTPVTKAIGEDTGEGSTLIIAQLFKEIFDTLAQYGDWSTLGVRRLGTKVTNFPIKTARVVANWLTSEAAPIADDTNEAGGTITLTVLPNAVLMNVSKQLIEDAEFDVTQIVMNDFQEAFSLRLDTAAFLGGTGLAANLDGGFTGIFKGGTAAPAAQGNTTLAQITYDDVRACLRTVAPVVLKRNPEWWMHPQIMVAMMGIKDNNGRPIFLGSLEAPNLAQGKLGSLLGFPVNMAMACPNTDGPGMNVATFGEPAGQVVGVRDDFVFEASDHYRWNTLERSFRAYGRAATGTRQANAFAVLQTAAR